MKALIVVDAQNDFFEGGALEVGQSNSIVEVLNQLIDRFELVVFTKDWHPLQHKSFAAEHPGRQVFDLVDLNGLSQVLWPVHCVQGQPGAEFKPQVHFRPDKHLVVTKGSDPEVDSYSGFFDNGHRHATELDALLRQHAVDEVHVCGLAADYCVKYTALDAAKLGYRTIYYTQATRAVAPETLPQVYDELRHAGVLLTDTLPA